MNGKKRKTLRLLGAGAALSLSILPVAAENTGQTLGQDAGHVRVQFDGGAAWTETGRREAGAPLPAGPAHANYGFSRSAQSGLPQDRLRVKPANY
jgi:hypothetical protein